ncbi:MAG: RND family efflux transporter MFP subunit [Phenylobacterium sp.]
MATRKQKVYPLVALTIGVTVAFGLASMKKPPEEKEVEIPVPVVSVQTVDIAPMALVVKSQGVVAAKYETRMVAQVSGEIVELADEFVRGGMIKKGQLLARIDPNDYEAAMIEAHASYASAIASLELEQAQGHVAAEEWKTISSAAPSDLGLRHPQLRQEQARVKGAEAAVKRAKRNLERTAITAPYDALIESRTIGLGSFVGTGTEIGKLMSLSLAKVRLPVAANELQYLANNGLGAKVTLVASSGGEMQTYNATIARSEGVVDSKSRMSYLVAEISNPYFQNQQASQAQQPELRFGTYVTASIQGIALNQATLIPRHLVVSGMVAVLDAQNKLAFKNVTVTREQDRDAVVTGGLNNGDQVITSALDYPVAGMALKLQSAVVDENIDISSQIAKEEG